VVKSLELFEVMLRHNQHAVSPQEKPFQL